MAPEQVDSGSGWWAMRDDIDRLEFGAAGEFRAGDAKVHALFAFQAHSIILAGLAAPDFTECLTRNHTAPTMPRGEMRTLYYPGFIRTVIMLNKVCALGHQACFVIIDRGAGTFYKLPLIAVWCVQLSRKRGGQLDCLFAVTSGA